jgi:hypothetical protein
MTKPSYVSDVVLKSELKGLRPLLLQWIKLIKEYCEANHCTDNPWWYSERANVGLLAGAAWRVRKKWHSLEEFPTDKRRTSTGKNKKMEPDIPTGGVEKKKNVRGRCDLYVSHASKGFVIEAKQAWQNLSPKAEQNRLVEAMRLARNDAGNLHPGEADHRIGAVFVVPFVPTNLLREKRAGTKKGPINAGLAADMIRDWIDESQVGEYSGYAYVYTKSCDGYISAKGDRLFPGVVLVLSRCKTGTYTSKKM